VANATDRVKSATTERVREMADMASETAQQAMDYTRDTANTMAGTARDNPIPLALIGIGAAWLLTKRSRAPQWSNDRRSGWSTDRSLQWSSERSSQRTNDRISPDIEDEGGGIMGRIRNNPIPAALAGVGLTWLAFSRGERQSEYGEYGGYRGDWREPGWQASGGRTRSADTGARGLTDNLTDSATDIASRTRNYASETADSVKQMARRRQNQLERMIQENPLLVGAGALMLGAAFGLAVPETEAENEWMGEARDNVVHRARDAARDAANQVQEAAGTVADAAKKLTGKTQS
jgi:ElaB/YqjD/DUF883 family membrane-anchored ribosome-binding protein